MARVNAIIFLIKSWLQMWLETGSMYSEPVISRAIKNCQKMSKMADKAEIGGLALIGPTNVSRDLSPLFVELKSKHLPSFENLQSHASTWTR